MNQFGPSVESYKALSIRGEGLKVGASLCIVKNDDEGVVLGVVVGVLESYEKPLP